jgi:uncharacterized protein (DUF2336 family)
MAEPLELLKELVHLAHERADESRCKFLRQVTDVFMLTPERYTDLQRQCFGEIIEKVAYDLEWQMRKELARRISSENYAPRKLVQRLAHDVIPVAQPVLEQSPVLTEVDLVQVSENRSQYHLLAITKRMDIGTRLAAVLVKHGDGHVIESLVHNQQAEISLDDIQHIAKRAESCNLLQLALVRRRDLPKSVMIDLFDHVSESLKNKLQERIADSDMRNLEDVIDSMKANVLQSKQSRAELHIDELARSGRLNEQSLLCFVKKNKPLEFLIGLAMFLEIDISTVQQVLTDETGKGLSIALRAADFSAGSFKEIVMCPMTTVDSELPTVMQLVRLYQNMPRENAQEAMRFLRMRMQADQASL